MDFIMQHLWAAGYDLPPEPAKEAPKPVEALPKRRKGRKVRRK